MAKFCVHIFGTVPDSMEVEAADRNAAIDEALRNVLEELDFTAEEEEPCPKPTPTRPTKKR
jgi:hypothetical protein